MCIIKRAARLTPGATARCCAVGSARGLGPRGRRFESCHLDHVGAKSALLRRLFLPAAQKAAGCVAPLLLLPAKSHAAPSLFACKRAHNASACYQLFADKGKGIVFYFCRAEALTGELRFCEAKWEFLKLPSNFSGESPERSAGDLPSPAKSHAAPSLFACKRAHNAAACYQLFADKGKGIVFYFCRAEPSQKNCGFAKQNGNFLNSQTISPGSRRNAVQAISRAPQKVTLRLRCSLINALTTLRLATNFLRKRTPLYKTLHPIREHHLGGGRELFCPR